MTQIENDAYLILVYKDFDSIAVSDYKEIEKTNTANTIDIALKSSTSKTNIWTKVSGTATRLLGAGLSSSIAQSMTSKIKLPNALKGRIQSSLYDIVADGKISNMEVAEDFINSSVNELDSVAIQMGYPTPDALYSAIKPDGLGITKDFLGLFQKESKKKEEEVVRQKNAIAQDLTVLKFKLVTEDSESWQSELPSRKTEDGFDIADSIQNVNKTKDFTIGLVNNPSKGVYIHDIKAQLEDIRDKKIPFDIYVNDPYQRKQLSWKYCFFTSVNFVPEGVNSFNCTMSVTKIPQYTVTTKNVSAILGAQTRKSTKATSSKAKATQTTPKKKDPGAYPIKKDVVGDINGIISGCNSGKYHSQAEVNKLFRMYTGYDATHFGIQYNKSGQRGFYYAESSGTVRR